MRLICGLLRLDGMAASPSLLDRMVAQMEVPGLRAARSSFCDGAAAMAVLDWSGTPSASLPVSGAAVIAADVRLDEPAEFARGLGLDPRDEPGLLLEAIRRFGSPEQALGDFAFAIWDRETATLTCGRDVFGIRPLSYVHKPGELFAFASVPAALHGTGIVSKTIDTRVAVRRAMRSFRFADSPIEGIRRLPPAHMLQVSGNGLSLQRYWQLDRAKVGTARLAPEEAAAGLRRLVEQAVRSRLPGTMRVGAHLSGGLDSSAITILAARALREQGRALHAYSFFDRLRNDIVLEDETEFVSACLAHEEGIEWQQMRPSMREFDRGYALDPDLMHPLAPEDPEIQVASIAERQGVGLILSGWGGDEAVTFNGRGAMAELLRRGRWRTFRREFGALAKERGWTTRTVLVQELASYLAAEYLPGGVRRFARRIRRRKLGAGELLEGVLASAARPAPDNDPSDFMIGDARENRWRLIHGPHIAHRTEVWAQIGARHGLAYAFPLLDRRVVEFALSLPSEFYLSGGFRRRVFRDAMRDVLPDKVRNRHRKDISFPGRYIDLAEARDALLARINEFEADARLAEVLDFAKLKALVAQFPSAEAARDSLAGGTDPEGRDVMIAASRAVELAAYLQQHGPHDVEEI